MVGREIDHSDAPSNARGPAAELGFGHMFNRRLYVAGRTEDVIVIRGRDFDPQDIELTVQQSSPVLRHGRSVAFTVTGGGEERLVIVTEVSRPAGRLDVGQVAATIRAAVAAEHCLQVHTVALLPPDALPTTSDGLPQRRLCATRFELGRLPELSRSVLAQRAEGGDLLRLGRQALLALPPAARRDLLREYLRRLLASVGRAGAREQGEDAAPLPLGADTHAMVNIRYSLETDLGVHLTLADLSKATSLSELASRLDELLASSVAPARHEALPADRSLWFMRGIELAAGERGTAIALRIRGELNTEFLDSALGALVTRQTASGELRAPDDLALSRGMAGSAARGWLREIDVGELSDAALAERLERAACESFHNGPMLRVHLYRRTALDPVLLVVVHHHITDFPSLSALIGKFELLFAGDTEDALEPPDLSQFVRHYSWISGSRASRSRRAGGREPLPFGLS